MCTHICTHTHHTSKLYTFTYKEIYFKELASTVVRAGRPKILRAGCQDQAGNSWAGEEARAHRKLLLPQGNLSFALRTFQQLSVAQNQSNRKQT